MAITISAGASQVPARESDRMMYALFRLHVQSTFSLPVPTVASAGDDPPDVTFGWGDAHDPFRQPIGDPISAIRCHCPEHNGQAIVQVFRQDGHTWIWHLNAGVCHIDPDGHAVRVYADSGPTLDEHLLGLILVGLASTFVLHQRGYPCLHGSAVRLGEKVLVFLGPKGQGKSTMAAGFLRRGATLLTDDMLPLRQSAGGIEGIPSLPMMKLWGQSVAHALELDEDLPNLVSNFDKKLFTLDDRFGFATHAGRLGAIYVLERFQPMNADDSSITIQRLPHRDGLMALITQTTLRPYLSAHEMAQLIPLYTQLLAQAPVRIVRFPTGFEHQGLVHDLIVADARDDQ